MRRFLLAAFLVLAPVATQAQETGKALNENWIRLQVAMRDVWNGTIELVDERNAAAARAADLESRLGWVLDHWVRTPPAVLPKARKP
jgi:hypothetical protein